MLIWHFVVALALGGWSNDNGYTILYFTLQMKEFQKKSARL
jgi:hypothetical protein